MLDKKKNMTKNEKFQIASTRQDNNMIGIFFISFS